MLDLKLMSERSVPLGTCISGALIIWTFAIYILSLRKVNHDFCFTADFMFLWQFFHIFDSYKAFFAFWVFGVDR